MQQNTEWELVDEPVRQSHSQWRSQENAQQRPQAAPGLKQLMQATMGPWWRWKLLGAGLFATLVMIAVAMMTGVLAVVAATGAVLAIGIGKVRQWTRRHGNALTS